jgi:agmatinase
MIEHHWFGLEAPLGSVDAADLAVFGVPYDRAVFFRRGAAEGPEKIRSLSGKLPPASEDGTMLTELRVLDLGDVMVDTTPGDTSGLQERVRTKWLRARQYGLPLALGGDHSISIALFAAASEWLGREFGAVWIDAHPDLCDIYSGSRFSHACVLRRALDNPHLRPENVVMLGLRSFELEEVEYIRRHDVRLLTARQLAGAEPDQIGQEIVQRFGDLPIYLSLDIDAFDPAYAPGTGIPDAGGLTSRWVIDLLHALAPLNLIGMDIVEVAPPLDVPSDPTSLLALKIILELLGNLAGARERSVSLSDSALR